MQSDPKHSRSCLLFSETSEDSCSSTLSSKNETLPPGCVLNGTNTSVVDVRECKPVACVKRSDSFNSSCTDVSLCCGPRSFESILVQCGSDVSFHLSKVNKCGCGKCFERQTVIQGLVVDQDDKVAKRVDLYIDGQHKTRTDSQGWFSVEVPKGTKRAIVTFKSRAVEEDKIFVVPEGQRVMYKVKLRKKPNSITFDASQPFNLSLGDASDSFAYLELPENALLTKEGSVFHGNAKATVSVTDPRKLSDILSAPGDFTTVNKDGEEQLLETYGMMKLNLEDNAGQTLTLSKPMKVYLDPEKLNLTSSADNISINLYWLDRQTGRWREAVDGNKECKRIDSVFCVGNVMPSLAKKTLNFDIPHYPVILRATTETEEDGVIVTAIRKDNKGYVQRTTDKGVVCMEIWKDKDYYLQAEKNFKYYYPDPDLKDSFTHVKGGIVSVKRDGETISLFQFSSALVKPRGPIYYDDRSDESERSMCEKPMNTADQPPKGRQFVFKPYKSAFKEYAMLNVPDMLQWISAGKSDTCLIKVKITGKKVLFMAASYDKKDQSNTGRYGIHLKMARAATSGSGNIVCFQFRCPKKDDYTALLLKPMTSEAACTYVDTANILKDVQSNQEHCPSGLLPTAVAQEKWLCIPFSDREKFTTYSGLTEKQGEARCLRGDQLYGGEDISEVDPAKYSVGYNCRYVR